MMMIHCVFSNGDAHSDLDCSTLAFAIAHYNKTHSRGHGKTHKFRIHSSVSNNKKKFVLFLLLLLGCGGCCFVFQSGAKWIMW